VVNEKNVLMTTDEGPDFIWNVSCVVPVLAVSSASSARHIPNQFLSKGYNRICGVASATSRSWYVHYTKLNKSLTHHGLPAASSLELSLLLWSTISFENGLK
jgi:hypothetical protein